jgi:hypothetical protein
MDLSFYIYIFAALAGILGGTYSFYTAKSTTAAAIFFVGSISLAIFFGVRWFLPSGVRATDGPWPPVINVCPDFLSTASIATQDSTGQPTTEIVCVDTVGVAGPGGIQVLPQGGSSDERYLFHLFASDPNRQVKLCQQCAAKKVTWEGVFDPSGACSANVPPLPPGAIPPTTPAAVAAAVAAAAAQGDPSASVAGP